MDDNVIFLNVGTEVHIFILLWIFLNLSNYSYEGSIQDDKIY